MIILFYQTGIRQPLWTGIAKTIIKSKSKRQSGTFKDIALLKHKVFTELLYYMCIMDKIQEIQGIQEMAKLFLKSCCSYYYEKTIKISKNRKIGKHSTMFYSFSTLSNANLCTQIKSAGEKSPEKTEYIKIRKNAMLIVYQHYQNHGS